MHAVVIPCPHCGTELKLKDRSLLGKKGKCPSCAQTFRLEEPVESDEVQLELVQPPPAATAAGSFPASFEAPIAISGIETGGVGRLQELRRKNRRRRNIGILVGVVLAVAIWGSYVYVKKIQAQHRRDLAAAEAAAKQPKRDVEYAAGVNALKDNQARFDAEGPTQGDPIVLNFMPPGAKVVINLHPAKLWEPGSAGEEFRFCLGPIGEWLGSRIQEISGFEPARIERMMICLIPGLRGELPEVAALVRLAEAPPRFEMIKRFQGDQLNPGLKPEVYLAGDQCFIFVDDQTFAVGPSRNAQDMADSISIGALTDPDLERLLLQTDRDRDLTVLFDPTILRVEQERWFPENARPLLNHTLDWIGDDVRAVGWSMHLGSQFYSELTLRSDQVNPPSILQKNLRKRLDELPHRVLAAVEMMQPSEYGKRRIISRFPAMTKAFALATEGGVGVQEVTLNTVLHERAAPNLALGTLLTWDESTRTDFNRSVAPPTTVASNNAAAKPLTFDEKLKKRIEIDFQRTPLQDAFAYIADESGIEIYLDGDGGLRNAGITKNVPQTLTLGEVSVQEAMVAILDGKGITKPADFKGVLVLVKDPNKDYFTLTTAAFAADKGMTPYVFK